MTQSEGIIIYGDSLSDSGRTYAYTNSSWPKSGKLGPNAEKFSNGDVWVDYLVKNLNINKEHYVNLAMGGATSNNNVVLGKTGPDSSWPVLGAHQQFETYLLKSSVSCEEKERLKNYFHILCIGSNDYYFHVFKDMNFDCDELSEEIQNKIKNVVKITVESILKLVKEIIEKVQPQKLGVGNLAPIQYCPGFIKKGEQYPIVINQIEKLLVAEHNNSLEKGLARLQQDNSNSKIIILPIYDAVVASLPLFENRTKACLDDNDQVIMDPDLCAFWDTFHPTTRFHKQIANYIFDNTNIQYCFNPQR